MTADEPGSRLVELTAVMARLRAECAWKAGQTHASLLRYLLEETYEVVEAVEVGTPADLREELGDLLLQVWFHAAIAAEAGEYDIDDVAGDLVEKLVRRNPHVFGDSEASDPEAIDAQWERIKAAEKDRSSVMEGVPEELPALLRAVKALDRLERAGEPVRSEDLGAEDLGDRLLALVVEARERGIDPEQALRSTVRRVARG